MKSAVYAGLVIGFGVLPGTISAAPMSPAALAPALEAGLVEPVDWRPYRHCHRRLWRGHWRRWCHGPHYGGGYYNDWHYGAPGFYFDYGPRWRGHHWHGGRWHGRPGGGGGGMGGPGGGGGMGGPGGGGGMGGGMGGGGGMGR